MRVVKNLKDKKHSVTFSIPRYMEEWFEKMQLESPGFNKNKLIIDILNEYMDKRGDYEIEKKTD